MTAEEIAVAALARANELSDTVPSTRSVMFRRLTAREQQLYARIAELNPAYAGLEADLPVVGGVADLSALDPAPERIVEVMLDAGSTPVAIVTPGDPNVADAPRAYLRGGRILGHAGELDAAAGLRVYYSPRPPAITTGASVPMLPAQFHELLVLDLYRSLVRKLYHVAANVRAAVIADADAEEAELLADFDRHVHEFSAIEQSRFGRTGRYVEPSAAPGARAS